MNGLRVVCMLWIIYGHTFFYLAKGANLNLKDFVDLSTMFSFNLVFAANFAVDIFFWMSGFLGAYLLMCTIKKKDGEMPNPLLILIHRILRITPLYALVLLFHWTLMASVGNGPIFFLYERDEVNTWHSTWWIKLTYSSTIPEIHDYENKCMGWSWYLADDMQFFIFIPIIVYLIYHKRIFGMLFIVFYQTGCFGLTLYFIIKYDVKATYSEISHNYYSYYYYPAYSRFAPFTIGILVAMMLYSFKNETEEESIWKKIMNKIDNQIIIRAIMYILGIAILITDYMFTYFVNIYPNSFSRTFTILYLIFSKALFIWGVSLIFLPAFMGHNRPTSWLFSQGFFAPLAKLTFGAYLVHPIFMTFDTFNSPGGKYVTMNRAIVNYLAWVVVSYTVSYLFSMLIEAPWINLESTFIFKRANRNTENNQNAEAPVKNFEDKVDVKEKDWENPHYHDFDLLEEDKQELSSNSSYANEEKFVSKNPLLK